MTKNEIAKTAAMRLLRRIECPGDNALIVDEALELVESDPSLEPLMRDEMLNYLNSL